MSKEKETPTIKSDNELLQEILKNSKSIKDNVQFIAWIIIISLVLTGALIAMKA
jgi:hypothetical protein